MAFKMRSGYKPAFKDIGSSPLTQDSLWSKIKSKGKEILQKASDLAPKTSHVGNPKGWSESQVRNDPFHPSNLARAEKKREDAKINIVREKEIETGKRPGPKTKKQTTASKESKGILASKIKKAPPKTKSYFKPKKGSGRGGAKKASLEQLKKIPKKTKPAKTISSESVKRLIGDMKERGVVKS